jgi:hypothetical protein
MMFHVRSNMDLAEIIKPNYVMSCYFVTTVKIITSCYFLTAYANYSDTVT